MAVDALLLKMSVPSLAISEASCTAISITIVSVFENNGYESFPWAAYLSIGYHGSSIWSKLFTAIFFFRVL
jgi:hypothetical protein